MSADRQHAAREFDHSSPFLFHSPILDAKEIFREMILTEICSGRLTARRRARIVRYAAQLGLSALQAGRLISECQLVAFEESPSPRPSLRLAYTPPARHWLQPRVAIVTGILLLIVWLIG